MKAVTIKLVVPYHVIAKLTVLIHNFEFQRYLRDLPVDT